MKYLSGLTEQQCIDIATIAVPNVKWKLVYPKNKWNGFDLIEVDKTELTTNHIFQIAWDFVNSVESLSHFSELHKQPIPLKLRGNAFLYIDKLILTTPSKPFKIYTIDDIQKVYKQHNNHCGTVLYSSDGGFVWQSVGMDSGKWDRNNWLFAFIA